MKSEITVFAPATVANVGCAFDVLGFALQEPGDSVVARLVEAPGVRITKITGDAGRLPRDPTKNTAGVSVLALLKHLGLNVGIELEVDKGLNIGSGLGSSSASTVAAVVAANELLGAGLSREQLLPFALEGERVACGSAHADNAAPCLLGGFVLIRSYQPLDLVRLGGPAGLSCAVVAPEIEIRTEDARKILRRQIPFKDAVTQWGNIGGLVAAIVKSDLELLARSLSDVIVEPERAVLIPGFSDIKAAAMSAGALGCGISGSGPAVFALCNSLSSAQTCAGRMEEAVRGQGLTARSFFSRINLQGAKIIAHN